MLTRTRVTELSGDGALVRDELTGAEATIRAKAVVNAAGVWADRLVPGVRLRPSRGTHLVLRGSVLGDLPTAVMAPVPGHGSRFVFALPQADGQVFFGLTDEPLDGPVPDVPEPSESEIGFLLDIIGAVFERPLRRADVVGAYAGLRPLLDADGSTADLSRRHTVLESPDGVVTVVGGKLTTYRRMAEHAVDAALRRTGLDAGPCRDAAPASCRRHRPARASMPWRHRSVWCAATGPRRSRSSTTPGCTGSRSTSCTNPIAEGVPVTAPELLWGLTHEGALDVDDLLDRRTRVGLVPADRALALDRVATLVGLTA